MTKPKDGGPAFPRSVYMNTQPGVWASAPLSEPGMTLRAWLAGQALQALIINPLTSSGRPQFDAQVPLSVRACEIADAVIAELEREGWE